MNKLTECINKFNTLETELILRQIENTLSAGIEKLTFLDPSPELRKYIILTEIANNHKITQNELAKKVHIVPAMINKYISNFRREGLVDIKGTHHRNTKYFLTEAGEELRKNYLFDFMSEILILYKDIKEEIKIKVQKIGLTYSDKILLFGAGEITELIVQCNDEIRLNIVGIVDSDKLKIGSNINGFEVIAPGKIKNIDFDSIIITSISKRNEIYKLRCKNNKTIDLSIKIKKDLFTPRFIESHKRYIDDNNKTIDKLNSDINDLQNNLKSISIFKNWLDKTITEFGNRYCTIDSIKIRKKWYK